MTPRYTIGIDEVGRGSLAGPVYAAAVCIPLSYRIRPLRKRLPLRDSKKLSALQRNAWMQWIDTSPIIRYAVSYATSKTVDKINVTQAANRAAYTAYKRLQKTHPMLHIQKHTIITDGGLHLPSSILHNSIIRGDEQYPAIMLASIIAKVFRDMRMTNYHIRYSQYGFDKHKGYGTRRHRSAIRKWGPGKIHRRSFLH